MFDRTQCKQPVIVLNGINCDDLEALLNYMYIGEVNVLQDKLSSLIKAAEGLRIKGLAVPDEDPISSELHSANVSKRVPSKGLDSPQPQAKKRRRDDEETGEGRIRKRGDSDSDIQSDLNNKDSHHIDEPNSSKSDGKSSRSGSSSLHNVPRASSKGGSQDSADTSSAKETKSDSKSRNKIDEVRFSDVFIHVSLIVDL